LSCSRATRSGSLRRIRSSGLAQRDGDGIDAVERAGLLAGTAAALAEHAQAVRLVDDQPGARRGAEIGQLGERRQLAGHRVHAVDDDHDAGARVDAGQPLAQVAEVVVAETDRRPPARAGGGVQAGVHVGVDEQHVVGTADRGQQTDVGVEREEVRTAVSVA
jgi:hypothetical protein